MSTIHLLQRRVEYMSVAATISALPRLIFENWPVVFAAAGILVSVGTTQSSIKNDGDRITAIDTYGTRHEATQNLDVVQRLAAVEAGQKAESAAVNEMLQRMDESEYRITRRR